MQSVGASGRTEIATEPSVGVLGVIQQDNLGLDEANDKAAVTNHHFPKLSLHKDILDLHTVHF